LAVVVSCESVRFKNNMIITIALAYIEVPDNCPANHFLGFQRPTQVLPLAAFLAALHFLVLRTMVEVQIFPLSLHFASRKFLVVAV
jgi:hypothetical protein